MKKKTHWILEHKSKDYGWSFVDSMPNDKSANRRLQKIIKSYRIREVSGGYME